MISELNRDNCWSLSYENDGSMLVAYLSRTASSRQLKALIELSEEYGDVLRIYVTRDTALKVPGNTADITGTPTYLLVSNDKEQNRLLGEADTQRLKKFVAVYLGESTCRARSKTLKIRGSDRDVDQCVRRCDQKPGEKGRDKR